MERTLQEATHKRREHVVLVNALRTERGELANSIAIDEAAMAARARGRLPSKTKESEELLNWIEIVYVRVGQLDLDMSEVVGWEKMLHKAICHLELLEDTKLEKKIRQREKDEDGGDATAEQWQHQPHLPLPLPPPAVDISAEQDAKQNALAVRLVETRLMRAQEALESDEKRKEHKEREETKQEEEEGGKDQEGGDETGEQRQHQPQLRPPQQPPEISHHTARGTGNYPRDPREDDVQRGWMQSCTTAGEVQQQQQQQQIEKERGNHHHHHHQESKKVWRNGQQHLQQGGGGMMLEMDARGSRHLSWEGFPRYGPD